MEYPSGNHLIFLIEQMPDPSYMVSIMEYHLGKPQKIMLYVINPGNFRLIDDLKSFCILPIG